MSSHVPLCCARCGSSYARFRRCLLDGEYFLVCRPCYRLIYAVRQRLILHRWYVKHRSVIAAARRARRVARREVFV